MKAKFLAAIEPIYPEPLVNKPWYEVCGNNHKTSRAESEVII